MGADLQTVVVLVGCFVIIMLACAVLILAEDNRGIRAESQVPLGSVLQLLPELPADEPAELAPAECHYCYGSGVVDIADGLGRTIVADADCRVCHGTGLAESTGA